jgi:hypothetical protein
MVESIDIKLSAAPTGVLHEKSRGGFRLHCWSYMIPAPSSDPLFNAEALKLLLQVAWADDSLDPQERAFVANLGPAWHVPDAVMQVLLGHLDRGKPLPQPNLQLLRTRPDAVIAAGEALIAADGVMDGEELDFMDQVRQLLGR